MSRIDLLAELQKSVVQASTPVKAFKNKQLKAKSVIADSAQDAFATLLAKKKTRAESAPKKAEDTDKVQLSDKKADQPRADDTKRSDRADKSADRADNKAAAKNDDAQANEEAPASDINTSTSETAAPDDITSDTKATSAAVEAQDTAAVDAALTVQVAAVAAQPAVPVAVAALSLSLAIDGDASAPAEGEATAPVVAADTEGASAAAAPTQTDEATPATDAAKTATSTAAGKNASADVLAALGEPTVQPKTDGTTKTDGTAKTDNAAQAKVAPEQQAPQQAENAKSVAAPAAAQANTASVAKQEVAKPKDAIVKLEGIDKVEGNATQPQFANNLSRPAAHTSVHTGATANAALHNAVTIDRLPFEIAASVRAGKREFEIRLDPAELGRIDVSMQVDQAGKVSTHLIVERQETLDQLRRDAQQLEKALQSSGLKTDSGSMQFSLRDQNQNAQNRFDDSQSNVRRGVAQVDLAVLNSWGTTQSAASLGHGRGDGVDLRL